MQLKLRTIIEEYFYDTEEEREEHVAKMEKDAWECSGQVRRNLSKSFNKPSEWRWYGKFFKYSE
jgi:hypothetical protein